MYGEIDKIMGTKLKISTCSQEIDDKYLHKKSMDICMLQGS